MAELTLEVLAARIEALEKKLAEKPVPPTDWRSVVGFFDDDAEFMEQVLAEAAAAREADRQAAREGRPK